MRARLTLLVSILVGAVGLFSAAAPLQAQALATATPKAPATPSDRLLLVVGGDQNYPPYELLDGGIPQGFNVDLIRAVGREMGFDVEIQLGDWTQARNDLRDKKIDLIEGMAYSPERDAEYDFSVPYTYISFDLFVPQTSRVTSLADLENKRILVQSKGLMLEYLQAQQFQAEITTVQDAANAVRLLSGGGYDAALLNRMQGEYLLHKLDIQNVKRVGIDVVQQKYGFAVADGNKELLARLNEGLYLVNASGELDELHEKWFGVYMERPSERVRQIVLFSALGVSVLLLIAIGWLWSLRKQVNKRTQDLARSEEQYRILINNLSEGVVITQQEALVYVNPAAAAIVDMPVSELVGKRMIDLIHPDDVPMVFDRYQRMLHGEKTPLNLVFRLITSKQESRWVQTHSVPVQWNEGNGALVMFIDITERRLSEEEIHKQLRYMAALRAVEMAIAASMDLSLTLRVLLEQVTGQLRVDAASILLFDAGTQQLVYGAGQGFQVGYQRDMRFSLNSGLAGKAVLKRRIVRAADLSVEADAFWTAERVFKEGFVGYIALPLISQSAVVGVLEIFNRAELAGDTSWMNFLEALANQAAIALENARLLDNLHQANLELTLAYDATISGWARAMEMRDGETEGHSQRVANLAVQLAAAMGLHGEDLIQVRRGALLHDIGKMAIPDSILKKQDNLTEEEWEIMHLHPIYSVQMLSSIDFLHPALGIPQAHHEWWNGSGYPRGLSGEEIPLEARIFSVVDVWDALVNERRYRKSWPADKVLNHIRGLSGQQFDPQVVEVFCWLVGQDRLHNGTEAAD